MYLVNDHWLSTGFRDGLWDTFSTIYFVGVNILHYKSGHHYKSVNTVYSGLYRE